MPLAGFDSGFCCVLPLPCGELLSIMELLLEASPSRMCRRLVPIWQRISHGRNSFKPLRHVSEAVLLTGESSLGDGDVDEVYLGHVADDHWNKRRGGTESENGIDPRRSLYTFYYSRTFYIYLCSPSPVSYFGRPRCQPQYVTTAMTSTDEMTNIVERNGVVGYVRG